jgi:hypothetical protein
MKNDQITIKESLYLIYAYVSISTFLLLVISQITENLGKALDFSPLMSVVVSLNMGVFVSLYYYQKKHNIHGKQNHY